MFYGYVNIIRISHGNMSTFLVHQLVSLCLLLVCLCPLHGHPQPTTWASADRVLGNCCPWCGQRVPKYRTRFWAIYFMWFFVMFKQSFCDVLIDFLRCFNSLFSLFQQSFLVHRAVFNDTSIAFHDTSMILLPAFYGKSH